MSQPELVEGRCYSPKALEPEPNAFVAALIGRAEIGSTNADETEPRLELDSHANIVVAGRNSFILNRSGKSAHVSAFTPEVKALSEVPIVDVAIAYDCPHSDQCYILVFHNVLSVPSMEHNLIPPFILREEAGIIVSDAPPVNDHSLFFPGADVRIPLSLMGIFSYFPSRTPTRTELEECTVLLMTPDGSTPVMKRTCWIGMGTWLSPRIESESS